METSENSPEESAIIDPLELFRSLAIVRGKAQTERLAYFESLGAMRQLCKDLSGVELKITGRLHARSNMATRYNDSNSLVEGLHIQIQTARVVVYEGMGEYLTQHLPFIDINGKTIETGETIGAWLGVGNFGVEAEVVGTRSVEV